MALTKLRECLGKYEAYLFTVYPRATARVYSIGLDHFLTKFPDKKRPSDFERVDVEDYKLWRQRDGVAKATLERELIAARGFFDFVIEMYEIPMVNPVALKPRRRPPNRALPTLLA